MKLSPGKRYMTRNGRVTGPVEACVNPSEFADFAGEVCESRWTWSSEGKFGKAGEHPLDLVAEYHEPVPPAEPEGGSKAIVKAKFPEAVCDTVPGDPRFHIKEFASGGFRYVGVGDSEELAWQNAAQTVRRIAEEERTTGLDPKGSEGAKKAPLHFLPSVALHETSWVLAGGAAKYGPWNWRENKVCMSTYRSAIGRHLDQWFDGREDVDPESQRSHLAHIMASAAILLDAMKHGTLVDDRPPTASQA